MWEMHERKLSTNFLHISCIECEQLHKIYFIIISSLAMQNIQHTRTKENYYWGTC